MSAGVGDNSNNALTFLLPQYETGMSRSFIRSAETLLIKLGLMGVL